MFCDEAEPPFGLPVPGQELMQTGLRQAGDAVEDTGEPPGLRVRSMSRLERRALPVRDHPALSLSRQCRLQSIGGTSLSYRPKGGIPVDRRSEALGIPFDSIRQDHALEDDAVSPQPALLRARDGFKRQVGVFVQKPRTSASCLAPSSEKGLSATCSAWTSGPM